MKKPRPRLRSRTERGLSTKAWQVGVYGDEWAAIVHADTRGKARQLGSYVDFNDFTEIRAVRLAMLDGEVITKATLIEAGFSETWEGEPIDPLGYIDFCGSDCELCKKSREAIRREAWAVKS